MAPSARGTFENIHDIAPDDREGGFSAFNGEIGSFAAGGDLPHASTQLNGYPNGHALTNGFHTTNGYPTTNSYPSMNGYPTTNGYHSHDHDSQTEEDEDEDEADVFTRPIPEHPKLDPSSRLSGFVNELTEVSLSRFFSRAALQQTQFPPRRRGHAAGASGAAEASSSSSSTANGRPRSPRRRRTLNEDDTSRGAKPSFVCPFYVLKPEEYRSCLKHDLRRIVDVKRHLWAAHRRPLDAHMRRPRAATWPYDMSNASSAADETIVSDDQLQRLAQVRRPADHHLQHADEDAAQWLSIWDIVFQGVAQPPPPEYVSGGGTAAENLVRQLDLLRGFWKAQGRKIISTFLESKGIHCHDARRDVRNLEALQFIVLNKMVDKLVAGL